MDTRAALKRARKALKRLVEFKPRRLSDPYDRKRVLPPRKGKGSYVRRKSTDITE